MRGRLAAHKVRGIRAALRTDSHMARMTRQHNDSNILCLGGKITGLHGLIEILDVWLREEFIGDRHSISLGIIRDQEEEYGLRIPDAAAAPQVHVLYPPLPGTAADAG